jgi:hypothetical protein
MRQAMDDTGVNRSLALERGLDELAGDGYS